MYRVEKIAQSKADGLILREKDLSEQEYESLAKKVLKICQKYDFPCILHTFPDAAIRLGASMIHLPLPILRNLSAQQKSCFSVIGSSCHSLEDALEAQKAGCSYITLGHIFATDCKKGLPPRGVSLLSEVCRNVSIPVYAIGGISAETLPLLKESQSAGACVMSGAMQCQDVNSYFEDLKAVL